MLLYKKEYSFTLDISAMCEMSNSFLNSNLGILQLSLTSQDKTAILQDTKLSAYVDFCDVAMNQARKINGEK